MAVNNTVTAKDHRGIGKRVKHAIGGPLFRYMTVLFNKSVSLLPYSIKYAYGTNVRANKLPYNILDSDDFVIQLGAPRDTLMAGRSRAIHFARLLTEGTVVVIEPDPANCDAFKKFVKKHKLEKRVKLIEMGAWDASGQLEFLSSASHPAANLLAGTKDIDEKVMKQRGYEQIRVPVDTLDSILAQHGLNGTPKLVSITTNGAERQILQGMATLLVDKKIPYISLALTGSGYLEMMAGMGYDMVALDDRGFTFKRQAA